MVKTMRAIKALILLMDLLNPFIKKYFKSISNFFCYFSNSLNFTTNYKFIKAPLKPINTIETLSPHPRRIASALKLSAIESHDDCSNISSFFKALRTSKT